MKTQFSEREIFDFLYKVHHLMDSIDKSRSASQPLSEYWYSFGKSVGLALALNMFEEFFFKSDTDEYDD